MTKASDELLKAAAVYAAAKQAVDRFGGDRLGSEFEAACATWRESVTALLRAARGVTDERAVAAVGVEQREGEPA